MTAQRGRGRRGRVLDVEGSDREDGHLSSPQQRTRIAIACQGGGSHTAFTAGVLKRLFGSTESAGYESSGSAAPRAARCAPCSRGTPRGRTASRRGSAGRFWVDNSASTPVEQVVNNWLLGGRRAAERRARAGHQPLRQPDRGAGASSALLVGHARLRRIERRPGRAPDAADRRGRRAVRAVPRLQQPPRGHHRRYRLASAAIPSLFPLPSPADGGTTGTGCSRRTRRSGSSSTPPDEIWVIQINPTAIPRAAHAPRDRRPAQRARRQPVAVPGAALHREDRPTARGRRCSRPGGRYRHIVVRIIELSRSRSSPCSGPSSKLNRDPGSSRSSSARARSRPKSSSRAGLRGRLGPPRGADADGRRRRSRPAPRPRSPSAARCAARRRSTDFLCDHFASGVCMDLSRKQVVRDHVTWTARGVVDGAGAVVAGLRGDLPRSGGHQPRAGRSGLGARFQRAALGQAY